MDIPGEWYDDMKHGVGDWKSNSHTYSGDWSFDMFNGQGTYVNVSGETYTGEYKKNQRDGHGSWKSVESATYVGQWADDLKHGEGNSTHTLIYWLWSLLDCNRWLIVSLCLMSLL